MDLKLKGKTALITGGSAGIGRAAAEALALEGVDVAIAARDFRKLDDVATEISRNTGRTILPIVADMMERDQIEQMVQRVAQEFGHIDILVNNAGASKFGDPLEIEAEAFAEAMTLKYLGYVYCSRIAAKYMIKQGWGRIINVLGSGGKQVLPMHLPGGATNAALELFTKGFALRLAPHGVLVNAISPAAVATERLVKLLQSVAEQKGVSYNEVESEYLKEFPLGRPARTEEVAQVIVFLASECGSYFVGSNIFMDGGVIKST
jgi:NAD(P)-dependent dehydrogenase (short-subunit alcohol dehydrogenase family)